VIVCMCYLWKMVLNVGLAVSFDLINEYWQKQGTQVYNRLSLPEFSVDVTLMCACIVIYTVRPTRG
jgi:hypothetical protein